MSEDNSNNIQQQDLVSNMSDDMDDEVSQSMNGSLATPTVVRPTVPSSKPGVVETPDDPALDNKEDQSSVTSNTDNDKTNQFHDQADSNLSAPLAVDQSELQAIKQSALQELGPLVEHIDQAPEERFDTLLMMIRSSDDISLIKPAHDAAKAITDEHKKAQALLDIINEVNYFTRPKSEEAN